jgi:hypothetical protein
MNKFLLKSQFTATTTNVEFQLDHIWANFLGNECKYGVTEAYWSNFHKLIYIALKLPNTFPMCNKQPLMFPFI